MFQSEHKNGGIQVWLTICLLMIVVSFSTTSCGRKGHYPVEIHRFEQLLFKTDEANLHHALKQHRKEYDSRLLNVMPDDELYMQELYGFVSDEQMQDVYRLTDSMYYDLSWLEFDLGRDLSILHEKD